MSRQGPYEQVEEIHPVSQYIVIERLRTPSLRLRHRKNLQESTGERDFRKPRSCKCCFCTWRNFWKNFCHTPVWFLRCPWPPKQCHVMMVPPSGASEKVSRDLFETYWLGRHSTGGWLISHGGVHVRTKHNIYIPNLNWAEFEHARAKLISANSEDM